MKALTSEGIKKVELKKVSDPTDIITHKIPLDKGSYLSIWLF